MSVTRGMYRHYKGDPYTVIGVGVLHDETRRVVVYHSTESLSEPDGIRLRYEDDFEAWVDPKTGLAVHVPIGTDVQRFARIESRRR